MAGQLSLVESGKSVNGTDRQKALDAALAQIDRAFGKGSVMKLGSKEAMQVEAVSTGSLGLDIALGRNHLTGVEMRLRQECLYREPFVFVSGVGHPLGHPERAVRWEDLRPYRWIVPLRGSPAYMTLADTLGAHEIVFSGSDVESSSLALNITLIKSGDFLAILPLSIARSHMIRGTMRVLPLPPLEALGEVVAYRRIDSTAPATSLFYDCLKEASADSSGESPEEPAAHRSTRRAS